MTSRGGDFVPTKVFDGRDLQAADLSGADLRGASLNHATMRGAIMSKARLDSASLPNARLQGAGLLEAQLRGADLSNAQLQGADLSGAQLQGADLGFAHLQGADLGGAQLQGAALAFAHLQGAVLSQAQLQGAALGGAQLQGAALSYAQLQGADLSSAQLQGSDLSEAQLQGADLSGADMSDSEFHDAFVFRTDISVADLATSAIRNIQADKVKRDERGKTAPLIDADIDRWIAAATASAGEEDKDKITQRFDRLKLVGPTEWDASDQAEWAELAKRSLALDPDGGQYRHRLVTILGDLACAPDAAPYVARGLVGNELPSRLPSLGDQLESVRTRMKEGRRTPETCPGVTGFTEKDWRALEAITPTEAAPADH